MIFINEIPGNENSVTIQVQGILKSETIPVLEAVCRNYWEKDMKIQLDLGGLLHISRDGMEFLREIKPRTTIKNYPKFLKL